MPADIVMPHMGESVAEGTILKWLKSPGDRVEQDEPVVEVGTDKIDVEIPSPRAGVLLEVLAEEGDTVEVDQKLATVGEEDEAPAEAPPAEEKEEEKEPEKEEKRKRVDEKEKEKEVKGEEEEPKPADVATGRAAAKKLPEEGAEQAATAPQGTESPGTRAPEAPPAPPRRPRDRIAPTQGPIALGTMGVLASPSVRRLARERLVDLGQVDGTGRMGRITRQDVLEHIEKQKSKKKPAGKEAAKKPRDEVPAQKAEDEGAAAAATDSPGTAGAMPQPPSIEDVDGELMPLTPMRKAVAEHMARSKHVAPHVTTVAEVDMTAAARFRKQYPADHPDSDVRLTFTALIANAAVRALHDYPALNASWTDKGIIIRYRIHLGLAVSVEDGLVVPVIRNADRMDLEELAGAIGRIAEKTREGKVSPSDLGEGTFTITNPGVFGAVISTPIIHQPQAAILATGRIADVPAVVDGGLAVRKRMYLSLSYDHRIVDGATAVQYLQAARKILEEVDFEVS